MFLGNFAKFTGKHLWQVAGLRSATLLKTRLWHGFFLVNFAKFLKIPVLQNTSGSYGLWNIPPNTKRELCWNTKARFHRNVIRNTIHLSTVIIIQYQYLRDTINKGPLYGTAGYMQGSTTILSGFYKLIALWTVVICIFSFTMNANQLIIIFAQLNMKSFFFICFFEEAEYCILLYGFVF